MLRYLFSHCYYDERPAFSQIRTKKFKTISIRFLKNCGYSYIWIRGNETEESSHAWNVIYPCDGSEPVLVDVTWDDGLSFDIVGQTEVDYTYFYIPLSSEYEHEANENMADFIEYINQ